MSLCAPPAKPNHAPLQNAYSILLNAIDSAQSFFDAFDKVCPARGADGEPSHHEQDLLRAALMFAAAGLDAMAKQLIRDALSLVIARDQGAQAQFGEYVQARLLKANAVDVKYLARTLVSANPLEHLKAQLVRELTDNSLQSKDQLLRVAAYFAVRAEELTNDLKKLQLTFDVRNQIAHEMDVVLDEANQTRRRRTHADMHDYTSFVLRVACAFYGSVERKL